MAAEFLLYLEILISTCQDTGEKHTSSSVARGSGWEIEDAGAEVMAVVERGRG
jgi:hypothetical protein